MRPRPVVKLEYRTLRQPSRITRMGECNDCGDCCRVWNFEKKAYLPCEHYRSERKKHCGIWHKRPPMCREWPRGPMDILNKLQCSYQFFDENGRKVDAYMDKRVKLVKIGEVSEEEYPFQGRF